MAKSAKPSFAFADPPYNAGVESWDVGFEWKHDYLSSIAPIVAVTPGISAIDDFMNKKKMPYKWSMSYWIDNGMTRGALGFGNWIYVALFADTSIHMNAQDIWRSSEDRGRISIAKDDNDPLSHKGRKPLGMMLHIVEMFTKPTETVVDPFLGSGTTLMVCQQLNRVCVGAEIDPIYCESILQRWERWTKKEAALINIQENASHEHFPNAVLS
jgi:DNA modification methylase